MWAARGLGYTCWRSYADSASGLGPDGLAMESSGAEKWVDVLESWEAGGRSGVVPGLGEDAGGDRKWENGLGVEGGKDYTGDAGYYLRPEVSFSLYARSLVLLMDVRWGCRLSRVCMSCGRQRANPGGANAGGRFSSRSRITLKQSMDMRALTRSIWSHHV